MANREHSKAPTPPLGIEATEDEEEELQNQLALQHHRTLTRSFIVCGEKFEIDAFYVPVCPIGRGAYGVVCSAENTLTKEKVAIKKISKLFDHPTDTKRTLREIQLMRHLRHENIVGLRDILPPRPSVDGFDELYVVSELMDTDLHHVVTSDQRLSDEHIQYFLYQTLRGLKFIHSANVIHRDLKPSNLLLNANCDLKICDFGLARVVKGDSTSSWPPTDLKGRGNLTEYVATRWYRAPEVILCWGTYNKALDMWAIGCILAELILRRPIFRGRDYLHQLDVIFDLLGTPTEDDLSFITNEKALSYLRRMRPKPRKNFSEVFRPATPLAVRLLEKLLVFDPRKRYTVEEALNDHYLSALHDPEDEPGCTHRFDFEWEKEEEIDVPMFRSLLVDEIRFYCPHI